MVSEAFLLSPDEVADVTGAKRRAAQLEWMMQHGIPAEVGQDGRVKVLRAAVQARMMPVALRQRAKTEPNLAALKRA